MKTRYELCVEIGEIPILVHTDSAEFAGLLRDRYGKFVTGRHGAGDPALEAPGCVEHEVLRCEAEREHRPAGAASGASGIEAPVSNFQFPLSAFELEVELLPPGFMSDAEDARVRLEGGRWVMERGDFRSELDPERRQGWVRQSANPYSIDAVLRMLHSLILARDGGFLVHAASAVRNGRAFLFAGVSGAGKTTISRLAPPDAVLLTDEISYVRKSRIQVSGFRIQEPGARSQNAEVKQQSLKPPTAYAGDENLRRGQDARETAGETPAPPFPEAGRLSAALAPGTPPLAPAFVAFGTPFAGELARIGENMQAPVSALYFLSQGSGNRIEALSEAEAVRTLLQNILFFAHDDQLVRLVFQTALDFVNRVPVRRLVFARDPRVWDLIK